MSQFKGREYRNFASPISDRGIVQLPYSGEYNNPGYSGSPGKIVHGYDIGNTLADAQGRDEAIRIRLGLEPDADIKKQLFNDTEFTRAVSRAQEEGIMNGEIIVNPLDHVVDQLSAEKSVGEDSVLITVGTYQMARSFLHGADLEKYVTALVTSEEAGSGNKKTEDMFLRTYDILRENGKTMVSYCDDSEGDVKAALEASKLLQDSYGQGIGLYHILT